MPASGKKGNKGGGRKSGVDEFKLKKLKNLSVAFCINALEDKNSSKSLKKDIALKVVGLLPREDGVVLGDLIVKWRK